MWRQNTLLLTGPKDTDTRAESEGSVGSGGELKAGVLAWMCSAVFASLGYLIPRPSKAANFSMGTTKRSGSLYLFLGGWRCWSMLKLHGERFILHLTCYSPTYSIDHERIMLSLKGTLCTTYCGGWTMFDPSGPEVVCCSKSALLFSPDLLLFSSQRQPFTFIPEKKSRFFSTHAASMYSCCLFLLFWFLFFSDR